MVLVRERCLLTCNYDLVTKAASVENDVSLAVAGQGKVFVDL